MLYSVSLNPNEDYDGKCVLGIFLMRDDAELFINKHYMSNDQLCLDEVDGVWNKWHDIREKISAKEAA